MTAGPEKEATPVAVITGGGGDIGRAAGLELARQGVTVIAMDPGVGVQGEPLGEPRAAETVALIEADGGTARASTVSVTDGEAVRSLFAAVVSEFGSLDMVVNTAGILRFSRFPDASEEDWQAVLDVHLSGYLNVLAAALPLMIEAGHGRVVAFTSGVGLARTSVEGPAYGSAKRAVAALTRQLGPLLPPGVEVNALSPIAASRMVREAMVAGGASPKGLDLSAMPQPDDMGPAAAYLASRVGPWCRGQVIFSAGSELSVIAGPQLVEAIRTDGVADLAGALGTVVPVVLGPAEAQQRTTGGSNPRFGAVFDAPASAPINAEAASGSGHCLIVSDDAELAVAVADAVTSSGLTPIGVGAWQPFDEAAAQIPAGFSAAAAAVDRASRAVGPIHGVVVALGAPGGSSTLEEGDWRQVIQAHRGVAATVIANAGWLRAAIEHAQTADRPLRVVHLSDAAPPAGRTSAQAVAQSVRSANDTPTSVAVDAFAVGLESPDPADRRALARLVARLLVAEDTRALRGAELVVARSWIGLRSHPEPTATVSFGGPSIPPWVDATLREIITGDRHG